MRTKQFWLYFQQQGFD